MTAKITDDKLELVLAAIAAIEKIAAMVRHAHAGSVSPREAIEAIDELAQGIKANNAAGDRALDERFPR